MKEFQKMGKDKVIIEIVEGAQHGDPAFGTNDNLKKVVQFLDNYLK